MTEQKKNIWIRDEKGELIATEETIELVRRDLVPYITQFLKTAREAKDLHDRRVAQKTAELLEEEYEKSKRIVKVMLKPLMSYELKLLRQKSFVIDGKTVEDVEAYMCSVKCDDPKLSYEEWRDTKDHQFKEMIFDKLIEISIPTGVGDDIKKALEKARLACQESMSSTNMATTSSVLED